MQDAIQGHHFNNSQAIPQPFTIYYLKDSTIQHLCICVVSDCMQHAITVHAFIKVVLSYIKDLLHPTIDYEVFQWLLVSTRTSQILAISCTIWMISSWEPNENFAICHEKSPCDGIGGTIKSCRTGKSLSHHNRSFWNCRATVSMGWQQHLVHKIFPCA